MSVAAALAENTLAGVTRARIGNSRVDANGGRVDVKAASTSLVEATPDAYAIAGSFGLGVAGAGAGYLYWSKIGCVSGGCPITSNPWMTTGFGALMGATLGWPSTDRAATDAEAPREGPRDGGAA